MTSAGPYLVLANSKKLGGHCVALNDRFGRWHRPVSSREHGELQKTECWLSSERRVLRLLDVVDVSLGPGVALVHQPEDRQLPETWQLCHPVPLASDIDDWLELAVDHDADFLSRGLQDRITEAEVATMPLQSSLALVRPLGAAWTVQTAYGGGRQVRASFALPDVRDSRNQPIAFDLVVTDPVWKARVLDVANGALGPVTSLQLGLPDDVDMYLTISLGEPLNGSHYKLVAAMIPRLRRDT